MAFGKGSSNFGDDAKVYSFGIKEKDLPSPEFEVKAKDSDDKWVPLKERATRLSANLGLVSIKYNERKWTGPQGEQIIKSAKAIFRDRTAKANDVYFVDIPFSFLGKSLMNNLLNLKTFKNLEISLYRGKPKADGPYAGKPGFASAALYQDKQMVKGRFERNELPAVKKVDFKGQKLSDTTDLDAFFAAQIIELGKLVQAANDVEGDAPSEADQVAAPVEGVPEHLDGPDNDDPAAPPF